MMVQVTTRVDKAKKQKFDEVCEQLGISSSNALSMFISGMINHNGLPLQAVFFPQKLIKTAVNPLFKYPETSDKPLMAAEDEDVFEKARREGRKLTREEVFGCMRGKFKMTDDFDAPLDDFKEYMA